MQLHPEWLTLTMGESKSGDSQYVPGGGNIEVREI